MLSFPTMAIDVSISWATCWVGDHYTAVTGVCLLAAGGSKPLKYRRLAILMTI